MSIHYTNLQKGACVTDDNRRQLFASPAISPFDAESFLEEHPELAGEQELDEEGNVLSRTGELPLQVQLAANTHAARYAVMTAAAKSICAECPVLQACREWVLGFDEPTYGVVGGMTEKERYDYRVNAGEDPADIPLSSRAVAQSTEETSINEIARALQDELA